MNGASQYGLQMVAVQLSFNVSLLHRTYVPSSRLVDSYPLAGSGCYQALGDLGGRGGGRRDVEDAFAILRISRLFSFHVLKTRKDFEERKNVFSVC